MNMLTMTGELATRGDFLPSNKKGTYQTMCGCEQPVTVSIAEESAPFTMVIVAWGVSDAAAASISERQGRMRVGMIDEEISIYCFWASAGSTFATSSSIPGIESRLEPGPGFPSWIGDMVVSWTPKSKKMFRTRAAAFQEGIRTIGHALEKPVTWLGPFGMAVLGPNSDLVSS